MPITVTVKQFKGDSVVRTTTTVLPQDSIVDPKKALERCSSEADPAWFKCKQATFAQVDIDFGIPGIPAFPTVCFERDDASSPWRWVESWATHMLRSK